MSSTSTQHGNNSTSERNRITAVGILSLIGFSISLYQTQHFHALRSGTGGFDSICALGETVNCEAIEMSTYAELFAGIPVSALAAAFFAALAVISFVTRNRFWRRDGLRAMLVLTIGGVAVSAVYLYIMLAVLKGVCVFCLSVDVINVVNLILVLSLKPEGLKTHKVDRKKWTSFAWIGAGSLLLALILSAGLNRTPSIPKNELDMVVNRVLSSEPVPVDVSDEVASIGPKDAPITIVKFSDFQCPGCRVGALSVHPLFARFGGQIRFVQKQFPLNPSCNRMVQRSMHPAACDAARAAVCAGQQGEFEAVYEKLFEEQDSLAPTNIVDLATEAGADRAKLEACMASEWAKEKVARDVEQGLQLNVESTPTFFINGHKVAGAYPTPVWVALIERLLQLKKAE